MSNKAGVRFYDGSEITKRESELHPVLKNVIKFVSKEDYLNLESQLTEVTKECDELRGGWISVDDELPNSDGYYLVFIDNNIDIKTVTTCHWVHNNKSFVDVIGFPPVTHWMPLPEPPTDSELEKEK